VKLYVGMVNCARTAGYALDNVKAVSMSTPPSGGGYTTRRCSAGEVGPLRDCDFTMFVAKVACTAGSTVSLSVSTRTAKQVVRVCEYSAVLRTGTACLYREAKATGVAPTSGSATLTFTCPAVRDSAGGGFSIYTAPLVMGQPSKPVTWST
jgi:hypothetical protein